MKWPTATVLLGVLAFLAVLVIHAPDVLLEIATGIFVLVLMFLFLRW